MYIYTHTHTHAHTHTTYSEHEASRRVKSEVLSQVTRISEKSLLLSLYIVNLVFSCLLIMSTRWIASLKEIFESKKRFSAENFTRKQLCGTHTNVSCHT